MLSLLVCRITVTFLNSISALLMSAKARKSKAATGNGVTVGDVEPGQITSVCQACRETW